MPTSGDMRIGKNLPKVTEYVKNIGKSISYSTVDYFKGTMEDTSDFVESNQELFKDIYHAARNYRRTMKAVDKSIRSSKVYEAGMELKKTLFDSIRTGKFYDAKRETYYQDKAAGDMGNMDDMGDWGGNDAFDINVEDEDFDGSDAGRSASIVSAAVQDATVSQAGIIARSSEYLAETQKASTRLLFAQGEKTYATMSAGFANTQSMLSRVSSFLEGPLTTHMENSTKFYQEVTNKMNEITAMMKESLEMQRNLYKKEQQRYEGSQYSKVGGVPDLTEYGKQVYKNFMDFLGPEAQMLLGNDMGESANMFMTMVANPLRFIPDYLVRVIVPSTIKKSLESIDKSFTGLFANFIARLNKWASDESDAPEFLKQLGRIFGLKTDNKTSVDTGKYEKGPVPFDGVTRKAITEVIPGYLARIESALTSATERVYDYQTGKWMSIKDVEKRYKNRKERRYSDAAWDISDDVNAFLQAAEKQSGKATADKYRAAYRKILKKVYEDYGVFEPYRAHGLGDDRQDPWDYYDIDKETFLTIARQMVGSSIKDGSTRRDSRKSNAMKLAASMLDSRESWGRFLRDAESGDNVIRHLFSGAYDKFNMSDDSITKDIDGKQVRGTGFKNILVNATDKFNKNIFYYLRGIYAELINFRNNGYGGPHGRPRGIGGPIYKGPSPISDLEKTLGAELDAEAVKVVQTQNANQKVEDLVSDEQFTSGWEASEAAKRRKEIEEAKKHGWLYRATHGDNDDNSDKGFLESLLEAGSLGEKFKVITRNINKLVEKPGLAIAGVIDTADRRLFQLVFGGKEGQEIVDKDGRTVKGFLEYLVSRTRETFDKMNDWLDENILEPLKKKLGVDSFGEFFKRLADKWGITDKWNTVKDTIKKYADPVKERLKEKLKWGAGEFKGAMSRTYGAAFRSLKDKFATTSGGAYTSNQDYLTVMEWLRNGEITDEEARYLLDEEHKIGPMASGGLITRRGIAIVSPGERIVPVGGKGTYKMNLAAEKAFARRHGLHGINMYAGGSDAANQPIQETERDAVERTIKTVTNEVMSDTQHKGIANVIASGLIGGGVSLLTGMVGGPLLGAAVGSAFGITQNSQTVQKWLFGEEVVNQETGETERSGGVISKEFQEKFKKYFPGMRDFGLAGAVAGLFTPLGLVGGLLAGSAIGFAKETDTFKNWIFGKPDENGERNGGLLKKEFRERVKKAAPRMAIGAVGAAIFGPFGILGNAVLGSALGYVTTTDQFKDFLLGKPDENDNGKRKGGVVGALYNGLLKPALRTGKKFIEDFTEFVKKRIFDPLSQFIHPFGQLIKNTIIGIGDHMKDFLTNMAQNTIGQPIKDFLEHKVFATTLRWARRILFLPMTAMKGLISAPFAALGFLGNNIRMGQIRRGTATDMTAAQRNEFRRTHRFRRLLIGRFDPFSKIDKDLAGLTGESGIARLKELKSLTHEYLNIKEVAGDRVAEKVRETGEVISDFLNNNQYKPNPEYTLYQANEKKFNVIKSIHAAIAKGDIEKVTRLIYKLNIDTSAGGQAEQLVQTLTPYVAEIKTLLARKQNTKTAQRELQSKLSYLTGGALHNTRNIRRYARLVGTELDAKEAQLAEEKAKNPEQAAADTINDTIDKRALDIINILRQINFGIRVATGQSKWGDPDDPNVIDKLNKERKAATEAGKVFDTDRSQETREYIEQLLASGQINEEEAEEMLRDEGISDLSNPEEAGHKRSIFGRTIDRIRNFRTTQKVRRRMFKDIVKDKVSTVGQMVSGKAASVRNAFRDSYHMVTTPAGESAAVDSRGRTLSGSGSTSNVRKYLKEQYAKNKEEHGLLGRIAHNVADTTGALFGTVTKTAGGAIEWVKNGIGGLIQGVFNNTGILGKIFGALPKIGLLAIGIAAAGHFSELWKTTIWPKFVQPALSWIWDKITGIGDFLSDAFPSVFDPDQGPNLGSFVKGFAEGFTEFITNPGAFFGKMLTEVGTWIADGWSLFKQNIFDPLWNNIIYPGLMNFLPYLSQAIYDAMHAGDRDGLLASTYGKDTDTVTQQAIDSKSGKKIWIDAETGEYYSADEKRNAADTAYETSTTVSTTNYKNDTLISQVRNNMFAQGSAAEYRKDAKDTFHNWDFMLVVSNEKSSKGQIVIQNRSTNEFIQLRDGNDSQYITFGYASNERGEAVAQGAGIGAIIGGGLLIAGTVFASIATGGLALPSVGVAVASVAATTGAGAAIGGTVYQMQGGGYYGCMDFPISCGEAATLLQYFGVPVSNGKINIDGWPTFASSVEYLNASPEKQKEIRDSKPGDITGSMTSEYGRDGFLTSDSMMPSQGSIIYIYNSYEGKVKAEKWTRSDGQVKRWIWLRAYFTYSNERAYYDTRNNYGGLPPEIQDVVDESKWVCNTNSDNTKNYPPAGTSLKDPYTTSMDTSRGGGFSNKGSGSGRTSASTTGTGKAISGVTKVPAGKPQGKNETDQVYIWDPQFDRATKRKINSITNDNWKFYQGYVTFEGEAAYYDTRKMNRWEDLPDEVRAIITEDTYNRSYKANNNAMMTVNYPTNSGKSRRRRRSALSRHLYQNAANLASKKFGNSTIGDAGCGPVAATNLLRRLSGKGPGDDLDNATKFALGYQDASGGTSPDYFTDIFRANGYNAAETSSKDTLLNSIASGNPAVLLGNSGKENGTPFGANNHYINAMGLDSTGKNMIVEDPDLPQSTVKYPVDKVMNDTITGVMTGGRRKFVGFNRMDLLKLKKGRRLLSGKGNKITVSKMAARFGPILYSGESGGRYSAVNKKDGVKKPSLSIGLIQWHAERAHNLLLMVANELGADESIKILGQSLYDEIVNQSNAHWSTRCLNDSEANKIGKFISTDAGKKCQDALMLQDIDRYINYIKNKGVTDENAIGFMCHLMNAYGYIGKKDALYDKAKSNAGSASAITLDVIYNTCMADSYYYEHYGANGYGKKIYNSLKNTELVGSGTQTIDVASIQLSTSKNAEIAAAAGVIDTDSTDDGSLVSMISQLGTQLLSSIFGSSVINAIGTKTSSDSSSSSSGSTGIDYQVNLPANATASQKQQALVDSMKSIEKKILYSLNGPQDPDKGSASCASTVSWAYNKVLGFRPGNGGHASSSAQAKDSRFTDIYVNNGQGNVNISNLQPGDIMYYNWAKTKYDGTLAKPMSHTEMYAGNGYDWNHGGNPTYGPVLKKLNNYRKDHLMKVRRYKEFVSGSGRSRRGSGYARLDNSTINRANATMKQYGLDSTLTRLATENAKVDNGEVYAEYFASMVTLLSIIANNTEAMNTLRQYLSSKGTTVDSETLARAAGNARKRVNRQRANGNNPFSGYVDTGNSNDIYNILNSPTGDILQVMEALAKE